MRLSLSTFLILFLAVVATAAEPTVRRYGLDGQLWEFRPGGALLELRPGHGNTQVVLLNPCSAIGLPEAVIGLLRPTATEGVFEASFSADARKDIRNTGARDPRHATVKFSPDASRWTIHPHSVHKSIKLHPWLPYIFPIRLRDASRPEIDGGVSLSPLHNKPIVL